MEWPLMPIDIPFLRTLYRITENNPDLFEDIRHRSQMLEVLTDADGDRNGEITEAELSRYVETNQHRVASAEQRRDLFSQFMHDASQFSNRADQILVSRQITLGSHATQNPAEIEAPLLQANLIRLQQVDADHNGTISQEELLHSYAQAGPEYDSLTPLLSCLRLTAQGRQEAEARHPEDHLPSRIHWLAYALNSAEGVYIPEAISAGWNHRAPQYQTWRGEMQITNQRRQESRNGALRAYEQQARTYPLENVSQILGRMREARQTNEVRILEQDLHIQDWAQVLYGPSRESRAEAALQLARKFREGTDNTLFSEGIWNRVNEFVSFPWTDQNLLAARTLLGILSQDGSLPPAIRNQALAQIRESSGEGRIFHLSDEQINFNNLWDEATSFGIDLLATRGAFTALRVGGALLFRAASTRMAAFLGARSGALGRMGQWLGARASSAAASEVVIQRSLFQRAALGLALAGRGVNHAFTAAIITGTTLALHQSFRAPQSVDWQIATAFSLPPNLMSPDTISEIAWVELVSRLSALEEMEQ